MRTSYIYRLLHGQVFVKAKKTKKKAHYVRSKGTVFGVRGTEFFVGSDLRSTNTWMCVNEGVVRVAQDKLKGHVDVKAGEGVNVEKGKLPIAKKFKWTKELNWKFSGGLKDIEDTVDVENMNYDLESFDYD